MILRAPYRVVLVAVGAVAVSAALDATRSCPLIRLRRYHHLRMIVYLG
jgi:hypothetical protein